MTARVESHSEIDRESGRSDAGDSTLLRRTVVAGAAWGVPVIMVATAAPAYAAVSQTVNLAFDKVQYVALGCQPISGATVTATNQADGRPVAGVSISVTLPRGFSYPTGATTFSGTTNTSGVVALPDIVTPSTGGTVTLTAVAATASTSASASVTVNLNTQATLALGASVSKTYASAAGGVSVGNRHFLTASGDLYFENTKIASGVASAAGWFTTNWTKGVCFVLSSGGAKQAHFGSIVDSYPAVPVGSKAIGGVGFLARNGDLYYGNSVLATGVVTAWGYRITATGEAIDFVGSDGVPKRILNGAIDKTYSSVPTNIPNPGTSVGNRHFLTASGDLYFENTKIASGVASAAGWFTTNWTKGVCFVLSSGGAKQAHFGSIVDSYPAVPVGSKAIGGVGFLAPNGDLYYGNSVLATGVVTAWGYRITATGEAIDFVGSDGVPKRILNGAIDKTYSSVPTGLPNPGKSVGNRHFLTASGDLYFENTKIASGVASAAGWFTTNWTKGVCFVLSSGGAKQAHFGSIVDSYPAVPVGSKAIGGVGFLAPNGDLYYGNSVLATGVVTAWGYRITATGEAIDFVGSDGVPKRILNGAIDKTYSSVPASKAIKPVGQSYFIAANGDLYRDATKLASNVVAARAWVNAAWTYQADFVTSEGKLFTTDGTNVGSAGTAAAGAGTLPVGAGYFLTAAGALYLWDTSVASNVTSAYGLAGNPGAGEGSEGSYVTSDARSWLVLGAGTPTQYTSVPVESVVKAAKPVGQSYFIAANGDLYRDATKLASNVVAARAWVNAAWTYQADFVTSDGKIFTTDGTNVGSAGTAAAGAGTLPVGAGYFLTSAGALYLWDTLVTSSVTSAYGLAGNPGAGEGSEGSFMTSDAKSWLALGSSTPKQYTSVPVESVVKAAKPVGQSYFIAANGDLYRDATKLASNVVAARAWVNAAWTYQADFVTSDGKIFTTDGTNVGSAGTAAAGAGTLPVGAGYFLTAAGALYLWDTSVASNVTSAYGLAGNPGAGEGSEGSYAVQLSC